jgi:isoaspartyl peptidase/L-asparaginase-like protein (Ntn-hydrolase superfamily)
MPEPILLSTWSFGQRANAAGWPYLTAATGSSLDAVEHACRASEADPHVKSVGLGGYPDRSGEVTLDAAVMRSPSQCGAVCYVRRFLHPVSIARLVMEKTPHVLLAGDGADRFAQLHGMAPADLLTASARSAWEKWISQHVAARHVDHVAYFPPANIEEKRPLDELAAAADHASHGDRPPHGAPASHSAPASQGADASHDTVGVLAMDAAGGLAGACSTSGTAFKVPGRVGDSPLIGHGLYVDPRVGAAVATGLGELIMGVCGSFLAVEAMRRGAAPLEAAVEVLQRIIESYPPRDEHQVAIIALDRDGRWSSAALRGGYQTAVRTPGRDELVPPERVMLA